MIITLKITYILKERTYFITLSFLLFVYYNIYFYNTIHVFYLIIKQLFLCTTMIFFNIAYHNYNYKENIKII